MSINWATDELGASLVDYSSEVPGCEAENILSNTISTIWLSDEGLPQWICLSLHQIMNIRNIVLRSIGWYCWHSYSTNPKVVILHVSADGSKFKQWDTFIVKKPIKGTQLFCCAPISCAIYPFLAFEITEVFGGDQTYMNRLYLYSDEIASSPAISDTSQQSDLDFVHPNTDTIRTRRGQENEESNDEEQLSLISSNQTDSIETLSVLQKLNDALGFNTNETSILNTDKEDQSHYQIEEDQQLRKKNNFQQQSNLIQHIELRESKQKFQSTNSDQDSRNSNSNSNSTGNNKQVIGVQSFEKNPSNIGNPSENEVNNETFSEGDSDSLPLTKFLDGEFNFPHSKHQRIINSKNQNQNQNQNHEILKQKSTTTISTGSSSSTTTTTAESSTKHNPRNKNEINQNSQSKSTQGSMNSLNSSTNENKSIKSLQKSTKSHKIGINNTSTNEDIQADTSSSPPKTEIKDISSLTASRTENTKEVSDRISELELKMNSLLNAFETFRTSSEFEKRITEERRVSRNQDLQSGMNSTSENKKKSQNSHENEEKEVIFQQDNNQIINNSTYNINSTQLLNSTVDSTFDQQISQDINHQSDIEIDDPISFSSNQPIIKNHKNEFNSYMENYLNREANANKSSFSRKNRSNNDTYIKNQNLNMDVDDTNNGDIDDNNDIQDNNIHNNDDDSTEDTLSITSSVGIRKEDISKGKSIINRSKESELLNRSDDRDSIPIQLHQHQHQQLYQHQQTPQQNFQQSSTHKSRPQISQPVPLPQQHQLQFQEKEKANQNRIYDQSAAIEAIQAVRNLESMLKGLISSPSHHAPPSQTQQTQQQQSTTRLNLHTHSQSTSSPSSAFLTTVPSLNLRQDVQPHSEKRKVVLHPPKPSNISPPTSPTFPSSSSTFVSTSSSNLHHTCIVSSHSPMKGPGGGFRKEKTQFSSSHSIPPPVHSHSFPSCSCSYTSLPSRNTSQLDHTTPYVANHLTLPSPLLTHQPSNSSTQTNTYKSSLSNNNNRNNSHQEWNRSYENLPMTTSTTTTTTKRDLFIDGVEDVSVLAERLHQKILERTLKEAELAIIRKTKGEIENNQK